MERRILICDIDGTIADCQWRRHFADRARASKNREEREQNWASFHENCVSDKPFEGERDLLRGWEMADPRNAIIYLTGRPDTYRAQTTMWLTQHGFPSGLLLLMRPALSRSSSPDFKVGQLRHISTNVMRGNDRILLVLEDDERCVAMWREMGLTCLHPRPGGY